MGEFPAIRIALVVGGLIVELGGVANLSEPPPTRRVVRITTPVEI
jgi:hypothetical protein